MRRLALIALVMCVAASCGEGDGRDGATGNETVPVTTPSSTPTTTEVSETPWVAAATQSDDRSVAVTFEVEGCRRFDHEEVSYDTDKVVITIFTSRVQGGGPNAGCTGQLLRTTRTVTLTEPVAGRRLVDGAKDG